MTFELDFDFCMSQGSRPDRVAEQIRSELALLLAREVHDPGIGFVTLTRVQVTPDLQQARVLLHGARRRQGAEQPSARSSARCRSCGARSASRLRLKRVPELEVHLRRVDRRAGSDRAAPQRAPTTAPFRRTPTKMTMTNRPRCQRIVDAIRARRRFVLVLACAAGRRLDRLAAGDGLRAARARQGGRSSSTPMPAPPPLMAFPGVAGHHDRADSVDGDFDAAIIMECGDLARTGVDGLDRFFVINIDHHPGNTGYGQINWFDATAAACGEMVFDVIRALGVPLSLGDRDAHLPRHPDRHRIVPLLEHLAAHVRDLPRGARGGRRSGAGRAQRLRQQQHGPAEAVRRGAERDADRRHRPHRDRLPRSRDGARAPAAPTKTPKG